MVNPRIPLVSPGSDPDLADLERIICERRGGEVPLLYQALLNSKPLASGWEHLLTEIRHNFSVPAVLREMVILRIAILNRATFEYHAHLPIALSLGLTDAKLKAIGEARIAEGVMDQEETEVLRLCEAMTLHVDVPDEVMAPIKQRYDAKTTTELVATIAAYNMVSRFLVALKLEH